MTIVITHSQYKQKAISIEVASVLGVGALLKLTKWGAEYSYPKEPPKTTEGIPPITI